MWAIKKSDQRAEREPSSRLLTKHVQDDHSKGEGLTQEAKGRAGGGTQQTLAATMLTHPHVCTLDPGGESKLG